MAFIEPITYAEIKGELRAARLARYAPGDTDELHPRVDKAIARATGELETELRKRYAEPDEVLAATVEPLRTHVIDIAIDYLSKWLDDRPGEIEERSKVARKFLKQVTASRADIPGLTPRRRIVRGSTDRIPKRLDTTDPCSELMKRMPDW